MKVTSANWVTRTSASPPAPGITNASGSEQQARSVPATSSARRRSIRRARREPSRPPTHGTPNATAYANGENPSSPSISTAISGAVAMIRAATSTWLRNSARSVRSAKMNRQPSNSPWRRTVDLGAGRGSSLPIARRPSAESAKLAAFATTVTTGPRTPIAAPPSGGPRIVAVQVVDSKRALATSSASRETIDFR